MTYRKDTASNRTREKKQDRMYTSNGTRSSADDISKKVYSSLSGPAPNTLEMPVPLKGIRATSANDTGVAFSVVQNTISPDHEDGAQSVMALGELLGLHRDTFVRLEQPLLVGLTLTRNSGEEIRVYCCSREIQRKNIRLILPCQLGLREGSVLNMELYLPSGDQPVAASGQVRKVSRTHGEDVVRYTLEVEFGMSNRRAESKIAAFIEACQMQEHRALPA